MNVLITGASRGLGAELASHFVASKYDCNLQTHLLGVNKIITCARSHSSRTGIEHISEVDFLNPETLSKLDPFLESSDVLINNAAMAHDSLLATQSVESISNIIQVNLTSTLILTKNYVRERLKAKKPGIIVNISSIIAIRGYAGLAAYSASKAGLNGMTRSLARELGPKGFRINSVLPGYFESEMSSGLSAKQKEQIINRTPLRRLATIEDIIPVVEFLISDDAKFITGQCIVVDGGITV